MMIECLFHQLRLLPKCFAGRVTNCHRCTYLVLDEADRMFDMGFEPQVGLHFCHFTASCISRYFGALEIINN